MRVTNFFNHIPYMTLILKIVLAALISFRFGPILLVHSAEIAFTICCLRVQCFCVEKRKLLEVLLGTRT